VGGKKRQRGVFFIKINISGAAKQNTFFIFSPCIFLLNTQTQTFWTSLSLFHTRRSLGGSANTSTIVIKDPREHSHDQRRTSVKIKESYQHLVAAAAARSLSVVYKTFHKRTPEERVY
jgi:hypothetical protein